MIGTSKNDLANIRHKTIDLKKFINFDRLIQ